MLPLLAAAGTGPRVVDFLTRVSAAPPAEPSAPLPEETAPALRADPITVVREPGAAPYVVLPEECEVDNRVATCLEEEEEEEGPEGTDHEAFLRRMRRAGKGQ